MEFDIDIEQLIMDEIKEQCDLETSVSEAVSEGVAEFLRGCDFESEVGDKIDQILEDSNIEQLVKDRIDQISKDIKEDMRQAIDEDDAFPTNSCVVHGTVSIKDRLQAIINNAPTIANDTPFSERITIDYFVNAINGVINEC